MKSYSLLVIALLELDFLICVLLTWANTELKFLERMSSKAGGCYQIGDRLNPQNFKPIALTNHQSACRIFGNTFEGSAPGANPNP